MQEKISQAKGYIKHKFSLFDIKTKGNNFPFRPKRFPFYYGFIILVLGTLGVVMSVPGQTMGVSVFTDFLIDAFQLSRNNLSLAYMFGTFTSAMLITYAGKLYDKYGARIIGTGTAIGLAIMLLIMTRMDIITAKARDMLDFVPEVLITVPLVTLGFLGMRFFGQGVLTMVSRNMVMKWFDQTRGLINGFLGVATSFGFSYAPRIMDDMINLWGWRQTWIILAAIIGLFFGIIVFIFFRDNPENCELQTDGPLKGIFKTKNAKKAGKATGRDHTLSEARRTYSFWIFNLGGVLFSLYMTAITFHIVSIFKNSGFDREQAIAIFLPASFISLGLHFGGSWLSDFIKMKYLLMLHLFGIALSAGSIMFLDSSHMLYLLILGNGIASGLYGVLTSVTWPRFFGLKHLGAISGYAMAWMVAGSAIGPYFFSLYFDFSGSYDSPALICLIIAVVLLLLSIKAENVSQEK